MRTRTRNTALAALVLMAATVPGVSVAADFDNTHLAGVYSKTSGDRAGVYVVDTAGDSKAAGAHFGRANDTDGKVVAWNGEGSRAETPRYASNKVVKLRSYKTDKSPVTADIFGRWTYNNG